MENFPVFPGLEVSVVQRDSLSHHWPQQWLTWGWDENMVTKEPMRITTFFIALLRGFQISWPFENSFKRLLQARLHLISSMPPEHDLGMHLPLCQL